MAKSVFLAIEDGSIVLIAWQLLYTIGLKKNLQRNISCFLLRILTQILKYTFQCTLTYYIQNLPSCISGLMQVTLKYSQSQCLSEPRELYSQNLSGP